MNIFVVFVLYTKSIGSTYIAIAESEDIVKAILDKSGSAENSIRVDIKKIDADFDYSKGALIKVR